MIIFRQLAVTTLRSVIWLSSPDTQEWAKAMLAELDSIGSDWKAFIWAIGSVRILFVPQTIRLKSVEDIRAAAAILANKMDRRTRLGSVVVLGMAVFFGRFFLQAANGLQQAGCVLIIIAMLYAMFQLVNGRPRRIARNAGLPAQFALFRSELQRELDFHRGRLFWSRLAMMIPGPIVLSVGGMIADPSTMYSEAIQIALLIFLGLIAIPNNLRFAKRYARQIQELEDLEARS